jgi:hypothetical protein
MYPQLSGCRRKLSSGHWPRAAGYGWTTADASPAGSCRQQTPLTWLRSRAATGVRRVHAHTTIHYLFGRRGVHRRCPAVFNFAFRSWNAPCNSLATDVEEVARHAHGVRAAEHLLSARLAAGQKLARAAPSEMQAPRHAPRAHSCTGPPCPTWTSVCTQTSSWFCAATDTSVSAEPQLGSGRLWRLTLPLGRCGSCGSGTSALGTMYSGSATCRAASTLDTCEGGGMASKHRNTGQAAYLLTKACTQAKQFLTARSHNTGRNPPCRPAPRLDEP